MLRVGLALALVSVLGGSQPALAAPGRGPGDHPKLDRKLNDRDRLASGGTSRAIIMLKPARMPRRNVKRGGKLGRLLGGELHSGGCQARSSADWSITPVERIVGTPLTPR